MTFTMGFSNARSFVAKSNKAALATYLQKNAIPIEEVSVDSATVIDGMVLVQRVKEEESNFGSHEVPDPNITHKEADAICCSMLHTLPMTVMRASFIVKFSTPQVRRYTKFMTTPTYTRMEWASFLCENDPFHSGLVSHTTDDMIFQWDPDVPLVVDENIELPQLQLVKNFTADCTQVYSTGNFTCLEVVFVLKRRLGYYLFHTYIPTCLIVIMSWVSFWIKPEAAPARVTLGVTSLLTLSTQHAKSQAALPPVSYLKAVDAFMSVCTVFVFMALMEYCLVNIVLGDNEAPKTMAEPPKPDKIFDLAAKENARLLTGQPPAPCRPSPAQRNRIRAINIDRFSRVFFPLLFAILNGRVSNHLRKTTLLTPNRDSNLNLPVIGSRVYCDSDALDHEATEAGVVLIA
uniref:Neurotransmitter-gated ion-channel transmembrane domain-containing protein n=1 Tax=Timema shepardi TaxID=629360 RepID=A0A7R9AW45_TIMSH|nr:unnamed protein product [Timema shepardi]